MKKSPLLALFFALTTVLTGGWAWLETGKQREQASFEQRRIALLEAENQRLLEVATGFETTLKNQVDAAKRPELEAETVKMRELAFRQPVTYETLKRSEIGKVIDEKLNEAFTPEEFEQFRLGYIAMGLLPEGYQLREELIALMGEQIGAYYDHEVRKVVTFENAPLENLLNRSIMVHELVHALQDQHFNLSTFPLKLKNNDDRVAAASSLAEGDAMLVMMEYIRNQMSGGGAIALAKAMFQTPSEKMAAAPRFLRETLLFPYQEGLTFCATLFEDGGYEVINAAFLKPPASTLQIMAPEKYLMDEEPLTIAWTPEPVLGQKPIFDNVLGALGVRVLLTEWGGDPTATGKLVLQWRGDRYLVYRSEAGMATVWRSHWSDERDELRRAVIAMLGQRYQAVEAADGAIHAPKRVLRVEQLGEQELLVIDAPNDEWANALQSAYGKPLASPASQKETVAAQE